MKLIGGKMVTKKIAENKTDEKRFFNGIYDYFLFFGSCVIVILFILFYSGIILSRFSNILSNALSAAFNIIASIIIAYKISYFSFHSQEKKLQRKLATVSIRHIRIYRANLSNLKKIVEGKKRIVRQKIIKQYFTEINNHIEHIIGDVFASELDIKQTVEGLVDEKYKEDSHISIKLQQDVEKLKRLQDKKYKKSLEKQIEELRSDIEEQVASLPFGYPRNVGITGTGPVDAQYLSSAFFPPSPSPSARGIFGLMGMTEEGKKAFLRPVKKKEKTK